MEKEHEILILNSSNIRQQNSFQGIHTAKILNKINSSQSDIHVYRVDKHDKRFLKLLCEDINLENRMPGLTKYQYDRWHEMLELATDEASKESNVSYIAAIDNKACGIISFNKGKKNFNLHCICTWPVEFGEKVKLAGQSLFYQMFKIFDNDKSNKLTLEAITNGPYDTVSKYKKLGFKPIGAVNHKVQMETNRYDVKNTLSKLDEILEYVPEKNPEHVKLIDEIEI